MFEDIINILDSRVLEWYKTTEKTNIVSAFTIGMNIVTSNNYQENEISIVNILKEQIKSIENDSTIKLKHQCDESNHREEELYESHRIELKIEKDKFRDLETKFYIDNSHSIKVAVELATKYITDHNETLKEEKTKLDEQLSILNEEYNSLKCNLKTSKIKGELTEHEVRHVIESNGYKVSKPGNHSGDLFVYSKENDELVCILEIKNYGEDNKHKLGPSGSETKKMWKDIETQLNSNNPINVPWLFISLGCQIPNINELRTSHCGVRCIYLDLPTNKEIITYIKCCEQLINLNNKSNGKNIILMQQKMNEIYDIINKLQEGKPDFNGIKDVLNKSMRKLEKEDIKYNKILTDTINRVNEILKNIKYTPDNDGDIDYTINPNTLLHDDCVEYVRKLQRNGIKLNRDITQIMIKAYDNEILENIDCNPTALEDTESGFIVPEQSIETEFLESALETAESVVTADEQSIETEFLENIDCSANTEILGNKKNCEYCNSYVINIKKHQNTVSCKKIQDRLTID